MRRSLRRRLLVAAALGAGGALAALTMAMLAHAYVDRARATSLHAERERAALVRLVGVADLAVSSSSRWLRHPSLSEPGAAFSDAPAMLDTDPAGAAIAVPRELYRSTSRVRIEVRHRGQVSR